MKQSDWLRRILIVVLVEPVVWIVAAGATLLEQLYKELIEL